jgi:hypothetical protein
VTFFANLRKHDLAVFDGNPHHHWDSAWIDILAYFARTFCQILSRTLNKRLPCFTPS